MESSNPVASKPILPLQPAIAWIAIGGLLVFTLLGFAAHAGAIIRYAFPAGCTLVGLLLYWRYPILYLGFTWWVWFLTPLVRRLVDWQSGWQETSVVLLTPFLVSLIAVLTLIRHLPDCHRRGGLPFLLSFVGVLYGLLHGLTGEASTASAIVSFLNWSAPILLSFHLYIHWQDYPHYRQNTQHCFLWGVLIMGIYGIGQYLIAPAWDRYWMLNVDMYSLGEPNPLEIRVFSTLNSPGPFAQVMMAGLLLLFTTPRVLRFPAALVGYLSFLLSLARSGWLAWIAGLAILITSLRPRLQLRVILVTLVMALLVVPVTIIDPFGGVIGERVQTLSDTQNDWSYRERIRTYERNLSYGLSRPFGYGLGAVPRSSDRVLDSGILELFFGMGWFGSLPYLGGLLMLFVRAFRSPLSYFDPFIGTARAISFGLAVTIVLGNVLISIPGILVWCFLSLSLAGQTYYQQQTAYVANPHPAELPNQP